MNPSDLRMTIPCIERSDTIGGFQAKPKRHFCRPAGRC
jgi:hypothetical protein